MGDFNINLLNCNIEKNIGIEITDFQMPDKMSDTIKYLPDISKINQTSCLVIL